MSFCVNCGNELMDNAKFCTNCGATVVNQRTGHSSAREVVYDGVIHKCPSCGEILQSFITNCPSCGLEIRGASAVGSVVHFYNDLNNANSIEQREYMIRNFPIPNVKEDIIEFKEEE